jgi:predicted negative regulator of RcsB-dependent stress response
MPYEVSAVYDFAIQSLAIEKYSQFEAIAKESAGLYQIQHKNRIAAEKCFKKALDLYKYECGSFQHMIASLRRLKECCHCYQVRSHVMMCLDQK